MRDGDGLPHKWAQARVSELADVVEPGFAHGGYNLEGIGVPHLRPMNIDGWGRLCLDEVKYVDVPNPLMLHAGDVLFNNTNSPVWVGKTTFIATHSAFSFSNHMTRVRFNEHAGEPRFFAFQLHHLQQQGYFEARCNHHVNQASIASGYLSSNVDLLVAPAGEQRRIVEAIEQQFSRLDAGVAALKRAQAALKRYRAAVLKAAVEGRLTAAWRAEHPNVEPASDLLQRILAERRAKWEVDMRAKGKDPAKTRYVAPEAPETMNLPELPESWCWAGFGQCFEVHVGATPSRAQASYWNGDISWVSSGEVQFCRVKETREHITLAGLNNSSTQLNPAGSVLLGMIGEGRTRGQAAILDIDACNNQNCAAIWVSQTQIGPEYIYYWLYSQYDNTRRRGSGNNQPALNKSRVEEMVFPLAPLAEQEQIVAEVEERLSIVSELEATLETNLKRAERLRQSILERAFAGKLVPQCSDDEPANMLLERIREQRERPKSNGRTANGRTANERTGHHGMPVTTQETLWSKE